MKAIAWAQQNRYVNGYGDGRFGPEDDMTVEQAMAMIYRFFGSPSADLSILDGLENRGQVSPWAREGMAWALANGFLRSVRLYF
ncbi:MAG: S-layer homology domain-containing protein [Clostridiales bacterium]|nr:S-layer homology domain-containing protein [Clostridiales bacterium]